MGDLPSLRFLYVTNLMDTLLGMSLEGKLCAFMLSFEAHSCALRSLWSDPSPPYLKPSSVPYSKLFFPLPSLSLFSHNNASFALFWLLRMAGLWGGVEAMGCTAIPACFQHVYGCGRGQSVALVKYISVHHKSQRLWSQPKIMPKRLGFFAGGGRGISSTLDVSCSCPLCSIGSYFGETWVLLSNLLSPSDESKWLGYSKKSFCRQFGKATLFWQASEKVYFLLVWGSVVMATRLTNVQAK